MTLKYYGSPDVVFQEVPGHVSLAFQITGCPLRCKGCHSAHTWKSSGTELSKPHFLEFLDKYSTLITCVLFFGGEWQPTKLIELLDCAQDYNLSTCLYTGQTGIQKNIEEKLTYAKVGPWIEKFGGLDSPHTNQRFYEVKTGEDLTHLFRRNYD